MSYPPQDPYNPGAVPASNPNVPADGQYTVPPNPTAPMPSVGSAYDQNFGQPPAYDPAAGYGQASAPPAPAQAAPPFSGPPAQAAPPFSGPPAQAFSGPPAPPFSGPPAPPFSGPPAQAAPPFSGPPAPPFSGPPAQPFSGVPGGPLVAGYGPAPAPKGKPTVLILAIVAGLLFVLGGVMSGLFISKNNELNDTRKDLTAQVAQRDATIATKDGELGKLRSDLEKAKADLDSTQQTLTGTRNERDQVQKEKAAITKCLNLMNSLIVASAAQDRAKFDKLAPQAEKACDEAEKYL